MGVLHVSRYNPTPEPIVIARQWGTLKVIGSIIIFALAVGGSLFLVPCKSDLEKVQEKNEKKLDKANSDIQDIRIKQTEMSGTMRLLDSRQENMSEKLDRALEKPVKKSR